MPLTRISRSLVFNITLLLLLTVTACSIAFVYCSTERFIYCWDYAGFWLVTTGEASLWLSSPVEALRQLAWSMAQDYPLLYTLAPTPLLLVLGESRASYILSLTLVYQLPFALLMGAIAAEIIRKRVTAVFWSTSFLTLLIPTVWAATLRGYPDMGAAVLVALAVWMYLRDPQLGRWWQIIAIGLLLAIAPIFRRHFAYTAVLFFLVAGVFAASRGIREAHQTRSEALRNVARQLARLGWVGAVFTGFLVTVGQRWLRYALSLERGVLYKSYEQSAGKWLRWEIQGFGGLIWLLAALGLVIAITSGRCSRERVLFFASLHFLTLGTWMLMIRQVGWQYRLHYAPVVVVGIALLIWSGAERLKAPVTRSAFVAVIVALLMVNLAAGFLGLHAIRLTKAQGAFGEVCGPLYREDYDEVMRLVDYLRMQAADNSLIYVIDSSLILNDDLLRKAEIMAYGTGGTKLQVALSPHADSRDFLPLEVILQANFVVTSDPFRPELGHLSPPQKVVSAGAKAVLGDWPTARDFERMPETFSLGPGVTFSVLRRVRPTPFTSALDTLAQMEAFTGDSRPPLPWILLWQAIPSCVKPDVNGTYAFYTHLGFSDREPLASRLAYVGPLYPHTTLELILEYHDHQCFRNASASRIDVRAFDENARLTEVATAVSRYGQRVETFSLPLDLPPNARGFVIEVSADGDQPSITNGSLSLRQLKVTPSVSAAHVASSR
jgi:hypothetical protein